MKTAPSSAATNAPARKVPSAMASAVPTSTGATPAGSVRGRAASSQILTGEGRWEIASAMRRSRPPRELREVRAALLLVGLAPLLGLVGAVEQEVGVVGQLLDAGVAVLVGVEGRLDQAQREGRQLEHLATPRHGLLLEALERHDRVDQAHVERLPGVVLAAQHPDLLGLLGADQVAQQRGAQAAVPRADARAGLAEARVVGGDRQVAAEVQDVAAADREAGDLRDDRLGQPAHLDLQVGDVEAADLGALGDVARVSADVLVAAAAEGVRA